jgi:hypothetical protein
VDIFCVITEPISEKGTCTSTIAQLLAAQQTVFKSKHKLVKLLNILNHAFMLPWWLHWKDIILCYRRHDL